MEFMKLSESTLTVLKNFAGMKVIAKFIP